MPASSPAAPRRKHVTTACMACRESKVKCDGAAPACSNCKNKGRDCRYQAGEDKRKLSLRVAIELLSGRVDQLCQFIEENGLQAPPIPQEDDALLRKVWKSIGISHVTGSKDNSINTTLNATPQPDPPPIQNPLSDLLQTRTARTSTDQGQRRPQPSLLDQNTDAQLVQSQQAPNVPTAVPTLPTDSNGAPVQGHPRPADLSDTNDDLLNWDWNVTDDPTLTLQAHHTPGTPSLGSGQLFNLSDSPKQPSRAQIPSYSSSSEEDYSDTENMEELVNRLSDRIGTLQIGPGGQVRYYGPTSNFNLVDMPAPDNLTVHRTIRNDGQECLNRLNIGKEVPIEIEDHLINLYFTWQDPALHVVNRDMYEKAKVRWRDAIEDTPYYSEALRNSMCSLGAAFEARHHPTFVTFPRSLADFFGDRAKALIEIELDCPCVATIQAMVVLSGYDIGCKRDARGWLYSGMAMRLAFDLALHVDITPYVAKGLISQSEADLRKTVFWGAYTVDHVWSFYLGRPFRINMEDVTVEKPGGGQSHSALGQWTPYVSPKSLDATSPLVDYTDELSRQRARLCEIMAPLGYALYGRQGIIPKLLQEMNEKTVAELLDWKTTLLPILQVDPDDQNTSYLPHVLLLHMQYYQNIIHAHRPWMSKTCCQPQPPQGPGHGHARMMCIESATAIAKLLQLYESRYTLRRMNIQGVAITCSAALLLIFAVVSHSQRQGDQDLGLHLSACFRALDEFSSSWENAKRARDFLVMLQRQWEIRARSNRACRPSTTVMPSHKLRKRTRTASPRVDSRSNSSYRGLTPGQQQRPPPNNPNQGTDIEMSIDFDWIFAADAQNVPQVVSGPWYPNLYPLPTDSLSSGVHRPL